MGTETLTQAAEKKYYNAGVSFLQRAEDVFLDGNYYSR